MRDFFPWAKWELRLQEFVRQGKNSTQAAAIITRESGIPVSSSACIAKAHGLGTPFPGQKDKWTEERIEILRRMWNAGDSAGDIARVLGRVSRNSVIGKVHRLKLAGRKLKQPAEAKKRSDIRALANERRRAAALRMANAQAIASPRIPFKPAKEPPMPISVSIWDHKEGQCRWPNDGSVLEGTFLYCGAKVLDGCSYCMTHWLRSKGNGTPRERAAA
jgi:GcrA cell cycle regulator